MRLIGREELIQDPRFATPAARLEREAEVDAIITEWTRRHTKEETMNLVSGVGVPAGAVFDTMELQNDASFEARDIMQVMDTLWASSRCRPGRCAWTASRRGSSPSPLLGEHGAQVLGEWLGLDAGELDALKREGVLPG